MAQEKAIAKGGYNFRWHEHMSLIASGAVSVLVVLKIYAVADWSPTTAKGIIAENGTGNVIIGSLLASLPMLYWLLFVLLLPTAQSRLELKKRTSVEKASVRYAKRSTGPS